MLGCEGALQHPSFAAGSQLLPQGAFPVAVAQLAWPLSQPGCALLPCPPCSVPREAGDTPWLGGVFVLSANPEAA